MVVAKRDAKPDAQAGLCGALLRLKPSNIDEAAIRSLVGDRIARSLPEVGREFGQAANTIKQSWRPSGMPGEQGNYRLADILIWRLRYLAEMEGRKATPEDLSNAELDRKQAEEELRKIRLQNDKLEREEQVAAGKVIDRESAGRAIRTLLAVLAERLMKLPSKWEPSYPIEQAPEWVQMQQRDIRRELVGASEESEREILAKDDQG